MADFLYAPSGKKLHSLKIFAAQISPNKTNGLLKLKISSANCPGMTRMIAKNDCPANSMERTRIFLKAVFISENSYRETRFSITMAGLHTHTKKTKALALFPKLFKHIGNIYTLDMNPECKLRINSCT